MPPEALGMLGAVDEVFRLLAGDPLRGLMAGSLPEQALTREATSTFYDEERQKHNG